MDLRRIEVGSRLRAARVTLKLTLGDVVREVPMGKSTLSSYENGRRTIDAYTLTDLCLLYGVSIDYIMLGTHMVPEDLRMLLQRVGQPTGKK